jgi:hypothetical protein
MSDKMAWMDNVRADELVVGDEVCGGLSTESELVPFHQVISIERDPDDSSYLRIVFEGLPGFSLAHDWDVYMVRRMVSM